jgi:hypothetical protein
MYYHNPANIANYGKLGNAEVIHIRIPVASLKILPKIMLKSSTMDSDKIKTEIEVLSVTNSSGYPVKQNQSMQSF